jgi:hypothetical protein
MPGVPGGNIYRVGGLAFNINPQPATDLILPDTSYGEFFVGNKAGRSEFDQIKVDIIFGRIPDTANMECIFKAENSWSILRDNGDYILKFEEQGTGVPRMIARFDSETRSVTLSCSSNLISSQGSAQNPLHYPLDQILLMYFLASREGVIVHAAGAVFAEKGCIFAGRSGAGKSTVSRKLQEMPGIEILSDDRIIIRKMGDSFTMFGTPWPGDAGIAVNKSAPLSQIFFLAQGEENRIERIKNAEAFRRFMPVLSIPWYDKEVIQEIFSTVEKLVSKVPSYFLHFTMDFDPVNVFEQFANGKH